MRRDEPVKATSVRKKRGYLVEGGILQLRVWIQGM